MQSNHKRKCSWKFQKIETFILYNLEINVQVI